MWIVLRKLSKANNGIFKIMKPANSFLITGYYLPEYFCNRDNTVLKKMINEFNKFVAKVDDLDSTNTIILI